MPGGERLNYHLEVKGLKARWSAERILTLKDLTASDFVIPEGERLCVAFHADGGQCCADGLRIFTDSQIAANFANDKIHEPGHNCLDSVEIFLTKEAVQREGEEDLRAGEPTLQDEVMLLNAQIQGQSSLVTALWRQLAQIGFRR